MAGIKRKLETRTKAEIVALIKKPLTIRELLFIKAFTNRKDKTFLRQDLSYRYAINNENCKNAKAEGWRYMQKPQVRMAVKEELESLDLKGNLAKAFQKIAKGFVEGDKSIRPKDVTAVADITYKVCGDYAPEKHLNFNLTEADRDVEYSKIIEKVREAQARRADPALAPPTAPIVNKPD